MAIDPELIVAAARGWIGTPYMHQASLRGTGCDCLGLLRGVWRELIGLEHEPVPPYSADWSEAGGAETLRDALARHLDPVMLDAVSPGDVVLFRMAASAPAKHCAIAALRDGLPTLIHARQNRQVCEEDFSPAWMHRRAFAFRISPWLP